MSDALQQGLSHVLEQDGKLLETLLVQINALKKLKILIDSYLDPKLASRCHLANFEAGHLAIITESAIWATQFRFQIPILQKKLATHSEFASLRHITCKVRPALSKAVKAKPLSPASLLSKETAQIIEGTANTITHSKLKAIMRKIASHIQIKIQKPESDDHRK